VNPKLPRDVDHILRKALRQEPDERYMSVDAFANDLRAFLESKPVEARAADRWYRTRKFLRRHRFAVTAAPITTASLLLGLTIANHERGIAQTRFLQVRQLANKILALEDVAGGLHNSDKAMHEIIAMSKEHLEALVAGAHADQGLALEVVDAYSLLARAEGICMASNSGQRARAAESLRKANLLITPVLSANPDDRKTLLTAARIRHDRLILAENDRRNDEALEEGRHAARYLDRLLELGSLSAAERETVSELFYNLALTHKNLHRPEDGIRYATRSIEVSQGASNAQLRLSLALSMLADLLRLTGDLDGALRAIREARASLENVRFPNETERRSTWSRVLEREGKILGVPGMSLNRPEAAVPVLQRSFDLIEEWAQADGGDAWSRLLFVPVGRELGDTLALGNPQLALTVYDHALIRIREVSNHTDARRGEAEILAASSYPLRRLRRVKEAKDRIDTALRLLAATKDYPADRIVLDEAAEVALRAFADHLAQTGHAKRAAEVYEDLLAKIMVSNPDPRNDLPHAVALSRIYGSLATLHRRYGERVRADELSAVLVELWRHWDRKLPNNGFVRRQLESTGKPAKFRGFPA
jgi:tetratricopeptide (TPR) repeat protein